MKNTNSPADSYGREIPKGGNCTPAGETPETISYSPSGASTPSRPVDSPAAVKVSPDNIADDRAKTFSFSKRG